MSVFEPAIIRAVIRNALPTNEERTKFDSNWKKSVSVHTEQWAKSNKSGSDIISAAQFEWIAHVVEYVSFLYRKTKVHGNSAAGTKPPPLRLQVPILGPRFVPPSYLQLEKRSASPLIEPTTAYLKPVNIVHPFYSPRMSRSGCPQCGSANFSWESWTPTGPRVVYGVRRPELALGYQLSCKDCETEREHQRGNEAEGEEIIHFNWVTTNAFFWQQWEYWEIPRGMPIFFHKCAVTRELFDLILELRLSSTSGGLAQNIKQLHLLEYHQSSLEYLESYSRLDDCQFSGSRLKAFSDPWDPDGFSGKSISADLITEILLEWTRRTREQESTDYLKTLSAVTISLDATFKCAKKAKITTADGMRFDPAKGGLVSAVNEISQTVSWQFSQSQSNAEIEEWLRGLAERFELQHDAIVHALHDDAAGSAPDSDKTDHCTAVTVQPQQQPAHITDAPQCPAAAGDLTPCACCTDGKQTGRKLKQIIADNCCHIRKALERAFPDVAIGLDVFHFLMRYLAAIVNCTNNPYRSAVAKDIRDAILISGADGEEPAKYWSKEEQEEKLQAAYTKWERRGGIWSAAAAKVHAAQMQHVRKGCLTRASGKWDFYIAQCQVMWSIVGLYGLHNPLLTYIEL